MTFLTTSEKRGRKEEETRAKKQWLKSLSLPFSDLGSLALFSCPAPLEATAVSTAAANQVD